MKRYTIRIIADFDIEAENIMHANHAAKYIRVIGERRGGTKPRNNRDFVQHAVTRKTETRHWVSIDEEAKP